MDFIMWKVHYTEFLSAVVLLVLIAAGVCALAQNAKDSKGGSLADTRSRARKKMISAGSGAAAQGVSLAGVREREDENPASLKLSPASLAARILAVVLALALAAASAILWAPRAFAAQFGGAENASEASRVSSDPALLFHWGNDVLWAGKDGSFTGTHSDNDILAAGQSIVLENMTALGSVRAAAQDISLENVSVGESVTLAGQHVAMSGGSAKSVALAGADAVFSGEADELYIRASMVSINGVVHGDVYVDADTLTLGDGAVVEGVIHASLGHEPLVAPAAQISRMDVELTESGISPVGGAGILLALASGKAIWGIVGIFVMTLLMEVLLRRQTVKSAAMVKVRTAPMLISGAVGALVAPVALLILMFTLVGIPIALALLFMLIGLQIIATGFACASLAKVVFPQWGRFKAVMLTALLVGVVDAIPFVGLLVPFAAFVYSLGYVLQKVYLGMRLEPFGVEPLGEASAPVAAAPGAPMPGASMPAVQAEPGQAGIPAEQAPLEQSKDHE